MKKKDIKAFRLKKSMLVGLATWLNSQSLEGRYSRVRSRFVNRLAESMRELEKDRQDIIGKYVEKEVGEDGKEQWKIATDEKTGGQEYVVSPEKMGELNEEVSGLYQEDFVVDFTPETEDDLVRIKDIILDTKYKFGPEEDMDMNQKNDKIMEANNYEIWCKAVEMF